MLLLTAQVKQQLSYAPDVPKHVVKKGDKSSTISSTISTPSSMLNRFKLTPEQRQVSSQAQWYVYSEMKISKRAFENKYFKNMLQVSFAASCSFRLIG
jgi:hypothetical protein